ncbi:hypothetical protein YC2023_099416 [Brassica napus]
MSSDATQITSYVSTKILRYEPVKQLIIAWLNGHFIGLIGLIHEILDREKLVGLMQNVEVHQENKSPGRIIYQSDGNSRIFNRAKGHNQPKSSATKTLNIQSTVLVFGQRSSVSFGLLKINHEEKPTIIISSSSNRSLVFGLLINHEEEAARKTQEEQLREWRYNKRTAEMIAEYERDQEKEATKSRPERDKWKKPVNKEATRSYLGYRSNGVKPSSRRRQSKSHNQNRLYKLHRPELKKRGMMILGDG